MAEESHRHTFIENWQYFRATKAEGHTKERWAMTLSQQSTTTTIQKMEVRRHLFMSERRSRTKYSREHAVMESRRYSYG